MPGNLRSSRSLRSRKGLAGLALVAVAALLVWGFFARFAADASSAAASQPSSVSTPSQTVPLVKTAVAIDGQVTSSLTYSGEVKAATQVSVLPKGSGRIEKLLVDVGSRVKQGDPIAELDADALRAQVNQAKANLAAAQAKYTSMQSGPRSEQVAQAGAALDSAQARLETVTKGATESALQAAQSQVDTARANLQKAQAAQETVKLGARQAEIAAAQAAVDQSKLAIKAAQANLDELKAGPKDYELWAAQQAVDAARTALDAANDRVQTWKGESTDAEKMATGATSSSQAVTGQASAQTALDSAVAKLNYLKGRPYPHEVQGAETALYTALANFESSKARLEQLQKGATEQDQQQAEASVQAAEAGLASAEAALKQLQSGATQEDIRVAEAAVVQAQQAYNLARTPYTQNDLAQVAAAVQQAEAAVELVEIGLRESVVKSPIDGIVAERLQTVGSLVSAATPIVSLVSPEVDLVLSVEEAKVWLLSEGQEVEVVAPAHPGATFKAKLTSIAPVADPKSRSFQVKARPDDPERKLRPGMFAQVKIAPSAKEKTVLVPKETVVTRSDQTVVFVIKSETVEQRIVTASPAQNGMMEIASGLEVGEEVVTTGHADLRDGDRIRKG